MVYLAIEDHLKKIDDRKIYTIIFTYYFHRTTGKWIYLLGGRKLNYGGVLPKDEMNNFLGFFGHAISGCAHSFEGVELKELLKRVARYIDYYGT